MEEYHITSDDLKEKLIGLITRGQELYYEYHRKKQQFDNSKVFGSIMKDLGTTYIKQTFGIPKKYTNKVKLTAETQWEISVQHQDIRMKYESLLTESKTFVRTISEWNRNLKYPGNCDKLLRKFNQLENRKKLETKIRTCVSILTDINQRTLVFNSELPRKRKIPIKNKKKEILKEDEIINNQKWIEYGTKILFQFETKLRHFIKDTLEQYYGRNWWKAGVPDDVKKDSGERLKREKSSFIPRFASSTLEYANFSDYRKIIRRKDNWSNIYKDYFGNQDKLVEGYFIELEKIRNAIQHNRSSVDADTINRFEFFTKEIINAIELRTGNL